MLGLAPGAADEVRGQASLDVVDRALDRGGGDVVAAGPQEPSSPPGSPLGEGGRGGRLRGGAEGGAAVEVDAAVGLQAVGGGGGDVDRAVEGAQELPEDGGGAVA